VPQSREPHLQSKGEDSLTRAIEAAKYELAEKLSEALAELMKQPNGFTKTLKSLNRGRVPTETGDVLEGVYERQASGRYDLAVPTDKGPLLLRNADGPVTRTSDSQFISSTKSSSFHAASDSAELTADELLRQLSDAGSNPPSKLLCAAEMIRFDASQHEALLPLLWQYILAHRDSNNREELVATGAAIRKYIAIMPMDRMGELAVLLESGHRSTLPIDLEIEVANMVFRNFEVHPPVAIDTQPELAQRLWEMVRAYVNPRILLRDKHSAVASLAIEAIVAIRSSLAARAWQAAVQCPYRWFAELVSDDLDDLHEKWSHKHAEAAAWLSDLRSQVSALA